MCQSEVNNHVTSSTLEIRFGIVSCGNTKTMISTCGNCFVVYIYANQQLSEWWLPKCHP